MKPTEEPEAVEIVFIAGYHPFQFYSMIVFLVTITLFVLYVVRWVFRSLYGNWSYSKPLSGR